jgi:hypothetical protein
MARRGIRTAIDEQPGAALTPPGWAGQ